MSKSAFFSTFAVAFGSEAHRQKAIRPDSEVENAVLEGKQQYIGVVIPTTTSPNPCQIFTNVAGDWQGSILMQCDTELGSLGT